MRFGPFFPFALLVIAVAVTFATRQRTLKETRAENETLRRQLEEPATPVESQPDSKIHSTNVVEDLSEEERHELLRLRGQIQPLRSELEVALSRAAEVSQARPERHGSTRASGSGTNQSPPNIQAHMQVMDAYRASPAYKDANAFASALRKYETQNGGRLPEDLAEVERYGPELPPGVSERFERMLSGSISEDARACTLFAREKDPQQQPDGWLSRVYIFADGTMIVVGKSSPEPNWTAQERRLEVSARDRAQQGQNTTSR